MSELKRFNRNLASRLCRLRKSSNQSLRKVIRAGQVSFAYPKGAESDK